MCTSLFTDERGASDQNDLPSNGRLAILPSTLKPRVTADRQIKSNIRSNVHERGALEGVDGLLTPLSCERHCVVFFFVGGHGTTV